MRAVRYVEHGGPEVLHVVDVAEPHAGPGQVRVEVKAVGVNPVDWKLRQGLLPAPLPRIPGSDVAGVVDEIGAGVSGVSLGDGVFGFAVGGGYAQYAVLEHFAAKPAAMSFEEAAGIPVPAETAVRVLDLLGVAAGDLVGYADRTEEFALSTPHDSRRALGVHSMKGPKEANGPRQ
jgi:NADPH:quinone reductase-like Zn-dependent oxidoreductase